MKYLLPFLLFCINLTLYAEDSFRVENTNFTISQGSFNPAKKSRYLYNYNRLRLYADYQDDKYFFHAIGDGISYIGEDFVHSDSFQYIEKLASDTPFATQSSWNHYDKATLGVKMYRLYGGYQDDSNRIVFGLQNITMGVGHIWTPSNLFNPKNSYALEPDETYGVLALSYTHYTGTESQIYGVVSQQKDHSIKSAAGFQTTLDTIELGINAIYSENTKMLGYTLQGDIGNTGIEMQSEGAYIEAEKNFFQGTLGADYAFENGLNLTLEALYSSQTFDYHDILTHYESDLINNFTLSHLYFGSILKYDFTIYFSASLLYIESFNEYNSRFIAPSFEYTINDNNSITLGSQLNNGNDSSEFGMRDNVYYFRYTLSY